MFEEEQGEEEVVEFELGAGVEGEAEALGVGVGGEAEGTAFGGETEGTVGGETEGTAVEGKNCRAEGQIGGRRHL